MLMLGDVALVLQLIAFCFGLVLLHHAKKEGGLVRAAAIVLIVGSILLAASTCTGMCKVRASKWMEHVSKEMKEVRGHE